MYMSEWICAHIHTGPEGGLKGCPKRPISSKSAVFSILWEVGGHEHIKNPVKETLLVCADFVVQLKLPVVFFILSESRVANSRFRWWHVWLRGSSQKNAVFAVNGYTYKNMSSELQVESFGCWEAVIKFKFHENGPVSHQCVQWRTIKHKSLVRMNLWPTISYFCGVSDLFDRNLFTSIRTKHIIDCMVSEFQRRWRLGWSIGTICHPRKSPRKC